MFVTTGGLDMLLTRTLQHTQQQQQPAVPHAAAGSSPDSSSSSSPPELLVQLLVFLQMLLGWGIGEAVRRGEAIAMHWHERWVCHIILVACSCGRSIVLSCQQVQKHVAGAMHSQQGYETYEALSMQQCYG